MNKKICLMAIMLSSSSVFASTYVGLEYGISSVDSKYNTYFLDDNVSLSPSETSDSFGGFVGYKLNTFGFELGYRQYDADASRTQFEGITGAAPNKQYKEETEWNADVSAKQLTFKPVYFYKINPKLQLKTGLGLTYTQYKYKSSTHSEYEMLVNDDIEYRTPRAGGETQKDNVFGMIASIGLEYNVIDRLFLGASASYQLDNMANTSSLTLTSAYYF
ncbi:AcfA family outer membrane beta-barrel protein [Aliivibrio fischeri]|uniref:AcfA family outer membrane beta-barrel protein n=1 Tax=Aliivibrio fischeri TaxID=668 RepID=UPI00080E7F86|nr:AcfA family outer membrane beta-barrel protein [Aliivibrio fischeri]OCH43078.1 peptide ABC transporter permease [Aliivibrio fischeri]